MSEETVSFSLEFNVAETQQRLRKLMTAISQIIRLMRRHFGSEDLNSLIDRLQQILGVINQVRLALTALQLAMAGTGGWLMPLVAVAGLISSVVTLERPRY